MTRTGEQLLARFFFPHSSLPALIRFFHSPRILIRSPILHPLLILIRLAHSSLFLIFHPLHFLIILIFHPLNKNLSPISLHLLFSPPLSQ